MKDFLKFKPGDIVIVTIGLPVILVLGLKLFMRSYNSPVLEDKLVFVILMMGVSAFIGWLWSVAIGLRDMIPDGVRPRVTVVKISLLVPLLYIMLLVLLVLLDSPTQMDVTSKHLVTAADKALSMMLLVFKIMNYLVVVCMLYNLYFAARTLKTAEMQRKVSFGEYVGYFVLVCLFPVGIWVIQPKINALMND